MEPLLCSKERKGCLQSASPHKERERERERMKPNDDWEIISRCKECRKARPTFETLKDKFPTEKKAEKRKPNSLIVKVPCSIITLPPETA